MAEIKLWLWSFKKLCHNHHTKFTSQTIFPPTTRRSLNTTNSISFNCFSIYTFSKRWLTTTKNITRKTYFHCICYSKTFVLAVENNNSIGDETCTGWDSHNMISFDNSSLFNMQRDCFICQANSTLCCAHESFSPALPPTTAPECFRCEQFSTLWWVNWLKSVVCRCEVMQQVFFLKRGGSLHNRHDNYVSG